MLYAIAVTARTASGSVRFTADLSLDNCLIRARELPIVWSARAAETRF